MDFKNYNKSDYQDIKSIHKHAGWFASYMYAVDGGNDEQGQALVKCQQKKIEQLEKLISNIKGEIELAENPKEEDPNKILQSIKDMIDNLEPCEYVSGYYKWVD